MIVGVQLHWDLPILGNVTKLRHSTMGEGALYFEARTIFLRRGLKVHVKQHVSVRQRGEWVRKFPDSVTSFLNDPLVPRALV